MKRQQVSAAAWRATHRVPWVNRNGMMQVGAIAIVGDFAAETEIRVNAALAEQS